MGNNILLGGKLGDFLHGLFVAKSFSLKHNVKMNIHMVDIGWEHGINSTFNELTPILQEQDYINSFSILTDYELDPVQTPQINSPIKIFNEQLVKDGYIEFGKYLNSPLLYTTCWTEILSHTFNVPTLKDYYWIKWNHVDPRFVGKVIIHRRYNPIRQNPQFPYEQIMEQYDGQLVFVSTAENDYDQFPYKDRMEFVKLDTLTELFTVVNSCELIVSNLTGITTIAHALDKLRIIELPHTLDAQHCIGEEKYTSNVFWYLNEWTHNLQ